MKTDLRSAHCIVITMLEYNQWNPTIFYPPPLGRISDVTKGGLKTTVQTLLPILRHFDTQNDQFPPETANYSQNFRLRRQL